MRPGALIVGLGRIGVGYDLGLDPARYVYSHARAFSLHPGFTLQAAVDPDATHRRAFEEAYGCPSHASIEDALRAHDPQVIVSAVPTPRPWNASATDMPSIRA